MQGRPAAECIHFARANIRQASQVCRGADLSRLQLALNLLESAAVEMRKAEADVRSGHPGDRDALCRETAQLKREVSAIMRMIDGCAAVCRGLSVRLGCTPLSYTPEGRAVPASAPLAACQLQG
jgi:hypothetical protein